MTSPPVKLVAVFFHEFDIASLNGVRSYSADVTSPFVAGFNHINDIFGIHNAESILSVSQIG